MFGGPKPGVRRHWTALALECTTDAGFGAVARLVEQLIRAHPTSAKAAASGEPSAPFSVDARASVEPHGAAPSGLTLRFDALTRHDASSIEAASALRTATALGRAPREVNDLRRWLIALSVSSDDSHYWCAAPEWLVQLRHDAGLDFYDADEDVANPLARVKRSFQKAQARYARTSENDRVYKPDEAARLLILYAVVSIAIGSRSLDEARTRIAVWQGDEEATERYARATAQEYRHGGGSPLGARYERLMDEARKTVSAALPNLSEFQSHPHTSAVRSPRNPMESAVSRAIRGADAAERARPSLALIQEANPSVASHLYLFRGGGLTLAASLGETAPPVGLLDFAREFVDRDSEAVDQVTV